MKKQTNDATLMNFDNMPAGAMVRLPVVMGLFGCSANTVWRMVADNKLKAYRLTPRTTAFSVRELRERLNPEPLEASGK